MICNWTFVPPFWFDDFCRSYVILMFSCNFNIVILCECNSSEVVSLIAFIYGQNNWSWRLVDHIILPFWFYYFCRSYGTLTFSCIFNIVTLCELLLWGCRSNSYHIWHDDWSWCVLDHIIKWDVVSFRHIDFVEKSWLLRYIILAYYNEADIM
jgi:hypothetical protein